MTTSPISLRAGPFLQNILDFSHQCNVEESMIMIAYNNHSVSSQFHMINIINTECWFVIILSFLVTFLLLVYINDDILVHYEPMGVRLLNVYFKLIPPQLHMGMSSFLANDNYRIHRCNVKKFKI